jgi:hypothetical protein
MSITTYSQHSQVAITLVYRYQPPARVPIDGENPVADNRNPPIYQHLQELYILNEHNFYTSCGEGNPLFF